MEKILTAFYFEYDAETDTRCIVDIIQPAEGMSEKAFRKLADSHDPKIKPHYEYINKAPY